MRDLICVDVSIAFLKNFERFNGPINDILVEIAQLRNLDFINMSIVTL